MSKRDITEVALKFLAYRSRTIAEMEKHLVQKEFAEEEVAEVIGRFVDYGYLNDRRYCQQYFDYAFGKGQGKRLVFARLKEKGIDSDTIHFAFEDWDGEYNEKEQALAEVRKVLRMAEMDPGEPTDEKLLAKAARRLHAKGYSTSVIYSVIGELRR